MKDSWGGWGVGNSAQTLGIELTENAERNERQEQVLEGLYKTTQHVKAELGKIGKQLSKPKKKQHRPTKNYIGANGNMKGEVQKNMNSPIQRQTEEANRDDTKVGEIPPSKLYFRDARVEYKSDSSKDLPTGLSLGRDDRKLGFCDKREPKAPLEIDQKVERDTDSGMAESENAENTPVTKKAPLRGDTTERGQYQNWYNYMSCQKCLGVNNL